MSLITALSIEVGASIAKSIFKLWLKDSSIASDASSTFVNMIKSKVTDRIVGRRTQRQFEVIGEKVGESLLPIFDMEGTDLDEGSRTAIALAVAETLDHISVEMLTRFSLEPSLLAKHLLNMYPAVIYHFNDTETLLYQHIISESCEYIVDIALQLPTFTNETLAEIVKRENQLLIIAEQVLQEVRSMRERLSSGVKTAHFELEYRRAVARNLDVMQLFGLDTAVASSRHRLSIAYITLSVEQRVLDPSHAKDLIIDSLTVPSNRLQANSNRSIISVDHALAETKRLLIHGLAGSGKTTLLQWIAVHAALQTFKGILADWNSLLPFFIRLRHCLRSGLPTPEAFPKLISPAIADAVPEGWVRTQLLSGRAIVLVDGLDEVPRLQREDVRVWLRDLIEAYPKAHYIVTSRPQAIKDGWVYYQDFQGFSDAELQPMELANIYTFIDHWHAAVTEELHDEEEKLELTSLAECLKQEVRRDRTKRNLATNPLLCAMLCALNRERRMQLPSDRIELYEICSQLLIERRDKERGIPLTDYPAMALTYRQKRVLLEDFAYWMIRNGWSEVDLPFAEKCIARKLSDIHNVTQEITAADIRRLFIERTGIVREPVLGYIDFTHRTFQEFLAAHAILDQQDIGVLIHEAHNDQWWEVIILATGLAGMKDREKIIEALIRRGDGDIEYRHRIHLLTVSCLESSIELSATLKAQVSNRLSKLVPPKSMTDAKALASARELAVPYLTLSYLIKSKDQYGNSSKTACIQALSLIGGDAALDALEEYIHEEHSMVLDELLKARAFFSEDIYAQRILSQVSSARADIGLRSLQTLSTFHLFTNLKLLDLSFLKVSDLSPLTSLMQLTSLNLSSCINISDLTPLKHLTQLTELDLSYCIQIKDLSPLTDLKKLKTLTLYGLASNVVIPQDIKERGTVHIHVHK